MSDLCLAVVQLTSTDNLVNNEEMVLKHLKTAVQGHADLVVFPENTLFLKLTSREPVHGVTEKSFERIASLIKNTRTHVLLTTPTQSDGPRFRNSTWLISPDGGARELYTKIHLFDVEVQGAPPVKESDNFMNGSTPATWTFKSWNMGLSICYDLRFPELFLNYAQKVDLILVPSAFLVPTGKAHWHTLLRARAIECQAYVAAPAQGGDHVSQSGSSRQTFGHSLVVDPWGQVLIEMETVGVSFVNLTKASIEKVRQQIPMSSHRQLKSP